MDAGSNPVTLTRSNVKSCYRCKFDKPFTEYNKNNRTRDGYHSYCRGCQSDHYRENKERHKANVKAWKRANPGHRYGLTPEEHDALRTSNGGMCHICNTNPAVHIDHDHDTGVVRGHLCQLCNQGLGFFRDSPALLREAAEYLESR